MITVAPTSVNSTQVLHCVLRFSDGSNVNFATKHLNFQYCYGLSVLPTVKKPPTESIKLLLYKTCSRMGEFLDLFITHCLPCKAQTRRPCLDASIPELILGTFRSEVPVQDGV